MYHKAARLNQTVSSIQLAPWLEGFIREHGIEQAMKFLSNVGVVDSKWEKILIQMIFYCTVPVSKSATGMFIGMLEAWNQWQMARSSLYVCRGFIYESWVLVTHKSVDKNSSFPTTVQEYK